MERGWSRSVPGPDTLDMASPTELSPPSRSILMFAGRSWDEWIARYGASHQNRVNLVCHTVGIPLIAVSVPLFAVALFVRGFWPIPTVMFVAGWVFQFVGHAVEGKPPEFFHD